MNRKQLKNLKNDINDRVVRVTTEIKRVDKRIADLDTDFNKFNNKAKQAIRHGRDDIAERILKKKNSRMDKITRLESHLSRLRSVRDELINTRSQIDQLIQQASPNKSVALQEEISIPEVPKITV